METTPTFTAGGREYSLELTFGHWKRIKQKHKGLDLRNVAGGEVFRRLASDPELLVDVIYEIATYDSGDEIDREAFEDSLDGDAIEAAGEALVEAIVGFSPSDARPAIRAVVALEKEAAEEKNTKLITSMTDGPMRKRVTESIDRELATLEAEMKGQAPKAPRRKAEKNRSTSGSSATSSPRSPASAATTTPSAAST